MISSAMIKVADFNADVARDVGGVLPIPLARRRQRVYAEQR
jgi:hypothetical protein